MSEATSSTAELLAPYLGQVRVRVCGLLVRQGGLLLVAHRGLLPADVPFWSPPGGGWEFGETLKECLMREYREETGLAISVGRFLHVHEFKTDDLQALELFFEVKAVDAAALPRLGTDPEHPTNPLLTEMAFRTPRELSLLPPAQVHPVLRHLISPDDIYIPYNIFR
ncbi:NUDIX domain-containing protein [Hymenobacter daecheongensis DSM 21074]|uniref:NUDIX domain-containing protein n=1 Tax=Hymenobacter daecheongensis DSM 21074 TaxID=1121955 RepID=A0A1M6F5X0_9BACT|nr:NUDIX hydrolase [Hymenobacter daecheongensis]SHI93063.1 NUDIX domain-containing protein [Hymenobacter daecheongensis DSM 21074]